MLKISRLNTVVLYVFAAVSMMTVGALLRDSDSTVAAACPAINATNFPASPYSNAELECLLQNGQETAYEWDECRRDPFFSPNATFFSGNIREMINGYGNEGDSPRGGCGYRSSTWLSARNTPNSSTPTDVTYGQRTVPLQINYAKFMAGTLVQPDYNGSGGWRRIYNDNSRWANGANGGNDTRPNAIGTSGQKPAHIGSQTLVTGLRAYRLVNGNKVYTGLSMSGGTNRIMSGDRSANPNSRYWFGRTPIPTTLNVAGAGITTDSRIYVDITYKRSDVVYKGGGGNLEYVTLCTKGNDRHEVYGSGQRYSSVTRLCEESISRLVIDFNVINPFSLTPTLTTNPGTTVRQGASITPNPRVSNTGAAGLHRWTLVRAIFNPGNPVTYAPVTNGSACSVALVTADNCVAHDFDTQNFPAGTTNLRRNPFAIPTGMPVGTNVCFLLAIQQPTQTSTLNDWRYSPLRCVRVLPPPDISTVQVWGYDTLVGGEAVATNRVYDGSPAKTQGSWAEYGIMSTGENTGFASAAGLNRGDTSSNQASWSRLTFANVDVDSSCGAYGCYGAVPSPDTLVAALKARCSTYSNTQVNVPAINNYNGVRFICSHDTVRIRGDITLSNQSVRNVGSLPQVVIIGKDIVIDKDVRRVDAWLIASPEGADGGNISTCTEATASSDYFLAFGSLDLTASTCGDPLVVNGPVVANKLYLYRTNPTNSNGDSAERFNLRADAFLWAYAGGGGADPIARTISTRELPPRF